MKKIVVISDSHGNFSALDKLLPIINESDYCIHLGDYQRDILAYRNEIKPYLFSVKGNCDGGGEDLIIDIDNVKILLTHGDRYDVKCSMTNLSLKAKEVDAKLVLFGHTHNADIIKDENITFINPGALNKFGQKSYAYIIIHNEKIVAKIVNF